MELFHETPLDGMADDLHVLVRRSSRRGVHVPDSDPVTAMRAAHDTEYNSEDSTINSSSNNNSNNSNKTNDNTSTQLDDDNDNYIGDESDHQFEHISRNSNRNSANVETDNMSDDNFVKKQ